MKKRFFETLLIIGLFGMVSTAINNYLSGVWVIVTYLAIVMFTTMVLHLDDKEKELYGNRRWRDNE